jgi:hypothetical protein
MDYQGAAPSPLSLKEREGGGDGALHLPPLLQAGGGTLLCRRKIRSSGRPLQLARRADDKQLEKPVN